MKAKVKRIKIGTVLYKDGRMGVFTMNMKSKNVLEFYPHPGGCKNWWIGTNDDGYEFLYHISWLKDIQE